MVPDYTINDAFQDGFEDGLLYMLRYMIEVEEIEIRDSMVLRIADHLAAHKPWRPDEQWALLIHRNLDRWRGTGRDA